MSSTKVPCGREQRGVVRLAVGELRGVVHGDVLHGGERAGAAKLDLAHVAHVKEAHAGAHGHVLGDQSNAEAAAGGGIFDRHVPSAEVDHLGLEGAMRGVECGLLEAALRRGRWVVEVDMRIPFGRAAVTFHHRDWRWPGQLRRT